MDEEEVVVVENRADNLEVIRRDGRYFVRYDAGAHKMAWWRDEISEQDAMSIAYGSLSKRDVVVRLQKRLGLDEDS